MAAEELKIAPRLEMMGGQLPDIEALLTTYRESLAVNHGRDARQSREAGRQAAMGVEGWTMQA